MNAITWRPERRDIVDELAAHGLLKGVDKVVLCVLENILTDDERTLINDGHDGEVIDARVAFQTDTQDEFTAAIQRLTGRTVVAFLSANQTAPGVACELFLLDATPAPSSSSPINR